MLPNQLQRFSFNISSHLRSQLKQMFPSALNFQMRRMKHAVLRHWYSVPF